MMLSPLQILLIVTALFFPKTGLTWSPFGPSDYDECILDGMKGVKSDLAAQLIETSCYEKFPPKSSSKSSCVEHDLHPAEVHKIQGSADVSNITGPWFSGRLYNPFTNKIIKSVTVKIVGDNIRKEGQIYKFFPEFGGISPQSSGDIYGSVQVIPIGFKWHLLSAKACDV